MIKIALLGYGKMGHEVERVAIELGISVHVTIDNDQEWLQKGYLLPECNVAIEFSTPQIAVDNIFKCIDAGIPVIVGTTGWYDRLVEVKEYCRSHDGTLFYASNFSIGVNIFFEINRKLASLLEAYPNYLPSMYEIHHSQKLDAPSGTAITLAEDIIRSNHRVQKWTDNKAQANELPILSVREGSVPGTHCITWNSEVDLISITHEAKNRRGLAVGALMAAQWVIGKKGVFSMKDMLAI